ncbi:MAG: tetratricopeptide repeat protein [Myxococcota bacterium]|nr:tetratricopeptide repeat protein [Myxococcota bacterium]
MGQDEWGNGPHDPDCAPTPEDDRRVAEEALRERDFAHAAHHIAGAIANDPNDPRHRMLMEEWVRRAPDPLSLLSPEDPEYYGRIALRAFTLAHRQELDDAVDELLLAAPVKAEVRLLAWLDDWLEPAGRAETLDPKRLAGVVTRAWNGLEGAESSDDEKQAFLVELASRVLRVSRVHPDAPMLAFVASVGARRAGKVDEAIGLARDYLDREPDHLVAVALGGAYRSAGRLEEAIEAFRLAAAQKPGDPAPLLDVADALLELRRPEDALATYDEVLGIDAEQPWARASALYLRDVLQQDASARAELEALAQQGNERAAQLLAPAGDPFVGYLPAPAEATINAVRQFRPGLLTARDEPRKKPGLWKRLLGSGKSGTGVRMALSCLEAPSSHVVCARMLDELDAGPFHIEVEEIPSPDPREPRRPVAFAIWRYDGVVPVAALPPPDLSIARAIGELAETPYRLRTWREEGEMLGARLGAENVEAILATMAHPPAAPAGVEPWDWMHLVQVAAAFALAGIDSGWEESARRAALLSLLHGPPDWSGVGAVLALSEIALAEPRLRPAILAELRAARADEPSAGYWCLEEALDFALARLEAV